MPRWSNRKFGGQGVYREIESEGHEEKYRAVIKGAIPQMNRSAKGGARSRLHYGGEGILIHPPHHCIGSKKSDPISKCEVGEEKGCSVAF